MDYGFRDYDTRIARFIRVDPLTAEFPMLTPYQYSSNNPILNIDLDGLEGVDYTRNIVVHSNGKPRFQVEDANNISQIPIYTWMINGTMNIYHNGKIRVQYNQSDAPTKMGMGINPGFYWSMNIKWFSDELLNGKNSLKDKVSKATGYSDKGASKPLENGFVNTFRHFAWQATITMALGKDVAKRAGDYHEADGIRTQNGAFAKDNVIDLLNNEYAREYGDGFNFRLETQTPRAYASFLNDLAVHITSTVDGYKDDKAYDKIRSGEVKLFNENDPGFDKLYESVKNLDQINAR